MSKSRAPTAATKFGASKFDIPPPKSEPLPLYPLLETKPAPLDYSEHAQYLAATNRSLITIFHKSADYLELPAKKPKIERYELNVVSKNDRPESKNSFENICGDIDPGLFPEELLPRKSLKKQSRKSKFDRIVNLLDDLEDEENKRSRRTQKARKSDLRGQDDDIKPSTSEINESGQAKNVQDTEDEDEDGDGEDEDEDEEKIDEEEILDDDEDLEAGGDYIDSYFDNGEGYEDNDDDGDEGPMY